MIEAGSGGSIVNISSQASKVALLDHTVYCKWKSNCNSSSFCYGTSTHTPSYPKSISI